MAATLNQAQLQILDMMSFIKSEDTLKELKQVISDFFCSSSSRRNQPFVGGGRFE